ncbi:MULTISPECIES: lysophospholipid acyltransferase family protein [unclassified Candidatus Tisiphia]|uniref:lysophospholipid acyltransferase family protein n=1 Tax=unclassified Candidatus Tisiphia TaxID=2996318 RepID=UPI001E6BF04F|nr:MAG: lysophospholipid acyltransferase family protein [Rickettsia endosymbiont of Cimex lectularius]
MLYTYLRVVYFTCRWQFVFSDNHNKQEFLAQKGVIFAFWHNRLALGPGIFAGHKDIYALISPHRDGRIISDIVGKFGFGVINGSSNKNPVSALKIIIQKLHNGSNIVITPDGPRGPIYKINSNINKVAQKYNIKLIPVSCSASRYFLLKSWDKLIMPLPFGKITAFIGLPLAFVGNENQDNINLAQALTGLK